MAGLHGLARHGFFDYIVVDPFGVPPDAAKHYSETVAYLPSCCLPRDTRQTFAATPTRSEAGLPETGFVFCCFNTNYKITPAVFDVWCELLRSVPDSVLWLLRSCDAAERNLKREAVARGVDPERLIFARYLPIDEHLARIGLADLFLDTIPYGAHTTASDALLAGTPVLACLGDTFPSRVPGSLLHAAGLPELITHDLDAYRALALRLASQPEELAALRQRLARNRDEKLAPLFDTAQFTRHLEALYLRMWERRVQNLPPDML
jgi:predicted O-linked N-acetylglucosamine transferase (SPINDLY family)